LVDLQRMAYAHKWSPIRYKSSAGQRKDTGQRPMLYRWTTQPNLVLKRRSDFAFLLARNFSINTSAVPRLLALLA